MGLLYLSSNLFDLKKALENPQHTGDKKTIN